jgi:hypothetical protein
MKGSLIVAVPDPSVVIYSDSGQPNAIQALSTLAKELARKSQKPISVSVLRWTETGWEAVAP